MRCVGQSCRRRGFRICQRAACQQQADAAVARPLEQALPDNNENSRSSSSEESIAAGRSRNEQTNLLRMRPIVESVRAIWLLRLTQNETSNRSRANRSMLTTTPQTYILSLPIIVFTQLNTRPFATILHQRRAVFGSLGAQTHPVRVVTCAMFHHSPDCS